MSLPDGRKVIAFDFDGVLHEYHGWNDGKLSGPMPGMLYVVDSLRAEGAYVVIHTTRKAEDITPWLTEHGFPDLPVYNEKWKRIDVFVDDRAYTFNPKCSTDGNADTFVRGLLDFQPHWRRKDSYIADEIAQARAEAAEEARAQAFEEAAKIAETPISGEQDDLTMAAKDRIAAALRASGAA